MNENIYNKLTTKYIITLTDNSTRELEIYGEGKEQNNIVDLFFGCGKGIKSIEKVK